MKMYRDENGDLVQVRGRFMPCPFCGATDEAISADRYSVMMSVPPFEKDHFIQCDACGATGPDAINEMAAVRAWNNRNKRNAKQSFAQTVTREQ